MGYADKSEAPILRSNSGISGIYILPVDYITIHSIVMGKQNGDCKTTIENIEFRGKKLGEQLSWFDEGSF